MRPVLLLLAAAAVLLGLGAGWFLLRSETPPAAPPGGPPGAGREGEPGSTADPGAPPGGVGPAGGGGPAGSSSPAEPPVPPSAPETGPREMPEDPPQAPRPFEPKDGPGRAPPPLPEGNFGEIVATGLSKSSQEKVETMRVRLIHASIGEVDWQKTGLRKVLDQIASKSEVPVEIEGKGLDEEPVEFKGTGENVLEILRDVTTRRRLRFEVKADRVVVKR